MCPRGGKTRLEGAERRDTRKGETAADEDDAVEYSRGGARLQDHVEKMSMGAKLLCVGRGCGGGGSVYCMWLRLSVRGVEKMKESQRVSGGAWLEEWCGRRGYGAWCCGAVVAGGVVT